MSLKEKMLELALFFDTVGYQGVWAAVFEEDTLIQKFLTRLNFVPLGTNSGMVVFEHKVD